MLSRYQEAIDYIDNIGILPTSETEGGDAISDRVHRFHQLEAPVRRVMDDIMLMSMECMQRLHTEVVTITVLREWIYLLTGICVCVCACMCTGSH